MKAVHLRAILTISTAAASAFVLLGLPQASPSTKFQINSPKFKNKAKLPARFTCQSPTPVSPQFTWSNLPKKAKAIALTLRGSDSSGVKTFLSLQFTNGCISKTPAIAFQSPRIIKKCIQVGRNDFGIIGYQPPCPSDTKRSYSFNLVALKKLLPRINIKGDLLEKQIKANALAASSLSIYVDPPVAAIVDPVGQLPEIITPTPLPVLSPTQVFTPTPVSGNSKTATPKATTVVPVNTATSMPTSTKTRTPPPVVVLPTATPTKTNTPTVTVTLTPTSVSTSTSAPTPKPTNTATPVTGGISDGASEIDVSKYSLTFNQDFTTQSSLSISNWGPAGSGGSTWISHTPYGGDWINFMDSAGAFFPFNIGSGMLTIRASRKDGNPYGGLIASVDPSGKGFSQQYGYFEINAQLPVGPGTWPAFWLMDVPSLVNKSINKAEIDILEQYGYQKGVFHSTLHQWKIADWDNSWGIEKVTATCSMTTGFHTYGVDIQPDFITFYYDRRRIWQYVNNLEEYKRPMYVMANMGYGGGGDDNSVSHMPQDPQDMKIKYIKAWQGSNGSLPPLSTGNFNSVSYSAADLNLNSGSSIAIKGMSLLVTQTGNVEIRNQSNSLVWESKSSYQCGTGCKLIFQNDGNLVLYNPTWGAIWSTGTSGGNLMFENTAPYLSILDSSCNQVFKAR